MNEYWVEAMLTHLLDIPVVLGLSLALLFTLLTGRPVLQFACERVDNFSGRGEVVIEATGFFTPLVSMQVVSRGEEEHTIAAKMLVPRKPFCSHRVQVCPTVRPS
jgi:hypothetical protein